MVAIFSVYDSQGVHAGPSYLLERKSPKTQMRIEGLWQLDAKEGIPVHEYVLRRY
jgi:hypothetical protein